MEPRSNRRATAASRTRRALIARRAAAGNRTSAVDGPRASAAGAETHRWTSRCVAFEMRAAGMVASRGCSRSARCIVKRAICRRSSVDRPEAAGDSRKTANIRIFWRLICAFVRLYETGYLYAGGLKTLHQRNQAICADHDFITKPLGEATPLATARCDAAVNARASGRRTPPSRRRSLRTGKRCRHVAGKGGAEPRPCLGSSSRPSPRR